MLRMIRLCFAVMVTTLLLLGAVNAKAEEPRAQGDDALQIMQVFNEQQIAEQERYELTDDEKHQILFFMGVTLLILLCTTAYLGVSMVVFNKEVFVPHMVSAGLTVTLGFAHAVAAVVWFFPF